MRNLDQRISYLMSGYFNNSCTEEELDELLALAIVHQETTGMDALLEEELRTTPGTETKLPVDWQLMLQDILKHKAQTAIEGKRVKILWWRRLAAAAVLAVVGLAAWFGYRAFQPGFDKKNPDQVVLKQGDVPPGKDGAILTLADGTTIVLDSTGNGALAEQNGVQVIKLDGQLRYNGNEEQPEGMPMYNTIVTPAGRQFQLVLADGTKVWMNAVSSIRFPTAFNGAERRVEITGEVYFEVARNEQKPFRVVADGVAMEVLGTAFNVNVYKDETVSRTTLAEGSLMVMAGNTTSTLKPGQQFVVSPSSAKGVNANVDEALAWKEGLFQFRDADIRTIMRQVARWYNVEVVYEADIPQRSFTGEMPRNEHVSELLKILKLSGINFSINGRTIVVKP